MHIIAVNNFAQWREKARQLLAENIAPTAVTWQEDDAQQASLFTAEKKWGFSANSPTFQVSQTFIALAKYVACHRQVDKWPLLYNALWRLTHGEKYLLQITTDPVVYKLLLMQKAIRRDVHKMKAFVRFKMYQENDEEFYIAWHKPDHKILELAAPFFQRRFQTMHWSIFTPDASVQWDEQALQFGAGVSTPLAITDNMEDLWRTFYRAIFNPARIKLKAMRREMPVRHWPTLPETSMIPAMLQEAPQRVNAMLKYTEGSAVSAQQFLPEQSTYDALKTAATNCRGCTLYKCAKQTVFGAGPIPAQLILVGEQPGDQEDIQGLPFQGPAGEVLNQVLKDVNIQREQIYMTNAVKHFKYIIQGNRRLHRSPNTREITACKPWLTAEIALIKPKLIVCLGVIAARALISHGFAMKEQHGVWSSFSDKTQIMATYHPSAVLRAVDTEMQARIYQHLSQDLLEAARLLTDL